MKKSTCLFLITLLVSNYSNAQSSVKKPDVKPVLKFTENKGQVSNQNARPRPDILFSGIAAGMDFHLRANGISYQLHRIDSWKTIQTPLGRLNPLPAERQVPAQTTVYRVDIDWLNCNSAATVDRGEALSGYENYYLASCPSGALNVKSYTNLSYKNIYPGIDLKWYEKNGSLKYDYYVSANTDYKQIQLQYKGADKIYIDHNGCLIIETPLGIIKEEKPLVKQNNKTLNAVWIVKNNVVSFDIKNADRSRPLIIDPMVRLWGTYYGGTGDDETFNMTTDAAGNVYMSGWTSSSGNIATSGAHQSIFGGAANTFDAFAVKFNSSGQQQWATYYGGTGDDFGYEVNCDGNGNVYVVGETTSSNAGVIATAGAHQSAYASSSADPGDGFLVMFNSTGARQWGTYYGGMKADAVHGLSLDNSGNIYIIGRSQSTLGIATPGSHQAQLLTLQDGFLAKFNSAGTRQWGTYYAGAATGRDCINNPAGDIYICGQAAASTGLATPGCHQSLFGGGTSDAYYAKFNSAGVLQWGTYYGGSGYDTANTIELDASGNICSGGYCASITGTVFASPGSHQPTFGGGPSDGYFVKFDPSGARLWGTYYGGAGFEGAGATLDASGNVYVYGATGTSVGTAIATSCSYQDQYGGGSSDLFVAKFTSTGTRIWGTYYGSIYSDDGIGASIDANTNIYLCGITLASSGTVMASSGGHQPLYGGGPADVVLVKFSNCNPGPPIDLTSPAGHLVCPGDTARLFTTCGNWYSSLTGTTVLSTGNSFTVGPLFGDTTLYVEDFACGMVSSVRAAISVTLVPPPTLTLTNSNPLACVTESILLTASGASTYSWTSPFTSSTSASIQVYVLLYTIYTVSAADANGCKATATITVVPNLCDGLDENAVSIGGLAIYPNPNNGSFQLQSVLPLKLRLNNELGQTVRDITLMASSNFTTTINDLPNGVYFLSGEKENRIFTYKIIVLK